MNPRLLPPASRPWRRRQLLQSLLLLPTGVGLAAALASSSRGQPSPGGSLHVLALADTGSGNANQQAVADRMAELHRRKPVDLVLLGGDNIYPEGDIALFDAVFRKPYRALLQAGVPFHAVLGNHDIRTGKGLAQLREPLLGMGGHWYTLRRGPAEFFMLDTNSRPGWSQQLPWLEKALRQSTARWKVVVGHHPVYSAGIYGDDPAAIARLTPLFRRYQVPLYINGHEHAYERSQPIDGTTYLGVGGGGAWLRPILPNQRSAKAISAYSFAELTIDDRQLRIDAWDSRGTQIDELELR